MIATQRGWESGLQLCASHHHFSLETREQTRQFLLHYFQPSGLFLTTCLLPILSSGEDDLHPRSTAAAPSLMKEKYTDRQPPAR